MVRWTRWRREGNGEGAWGRGREGGENAHRCTHLMQNGGNLAVSIHKENASVALRF